MTYSLFVIAMIIMGICVSGIAIITFIHNINNIRKNNNKKL